MKKVLTVNAQVIDATQVSESYLSQFDEIKLRAARLYTNDVTKERLASLRVITNCSSTYNLPVGESVNVAVSETNINGSGHIGKGAKPTEGTLAFLNVNGRGIVEPDAGDILQYFEQINVNGELLIPQGSPVGSRINVNGATTYYPTGVQLMEGNLTEGFIRQAEGEYMWLDDLEVLEPLPLEELKRKGVRIYADSVLANAAQGAALREVCTADRWEFVPEGYTLIKSPKFTKTNVRVYGEYWYIRGNLELTTDDSECLGCLKGITVTGTVTMPESMADAYMAIRNEGGDVETYRGEMIRFAHNGNARIYAALLRDLKDGATIQVRHSTLYIDEDVKAEDCEAIFKLDLAHSQLIASDEIQIALRKRMTLRHSSIVRPGEKAPEEVEEAKANETVINGSVVVL